MILPLLDKKIRQAFSNSALQYEVLSGLQKEIGRELIRKIMDKDECSRILDVGMGPGWSTNRLNNLFPESYNVGLDFASGMVKIARKKYEQMHIVQADAARLPFKNHSFDVIISNLTYQWVKNLTQAFQCAHALLKKDGALYLTMFGRETLKELFLSMEECFAEKNKKAKLPFQRMASQEDVQKAVESAGFKNVKIKNEFIKSHFPDMMALMRWLKKIGANVNAENVYLGKDFLTRSNRFYGENFSDRLGVYATFEVIWVEAQKQ